MVWEKKRIVSDQNPKMILCPRCGIKRTPSFANEILLCQKCRTIIANPPPGKDVIK